jgi:arylsulfatase A-like enzyme
MTRILLVLFDGLRPDVVEPSRMPNLSRLRGQGAWFRNARSVFPSETRVASPSLSTGCRPGSHGLVANTLFDAARAPQRLLRTKNPADLAVLANGQGSPLARPSLPERLAAAGRSFALVATCSPGAAMLMHPRGEEAGGFRWIADETEGPTAAAMAKRFGLTPPAEVPNLRRLEHAARILIEHVLPERRPDVALIWLSEPDVSFHYAGLGAPEAVAALAAADAVLGRIMAWREAQPDREEIVLVALSDHGHVTGEGKFSLAERLREGGFAAGQGLGEGTEVVVAPGGAPGLWVADAALLPRLAAWLAAQPWCGALLARDPAALPEGQALPLELLGSRHPRSPDLVATFRGSGEPDGWGLPGRAPFDAPDVPEGGGMHGGLHAAELATLLLLAGGPMRRGAEVESVCDLTDVAPTVLALLGLAPEGMEGRPLQGAWQAGADAPPRPVQLPLRGDLALAGLVEPASGRFYPSALTTGAGTGRQ